MTQMKTKMMNFKKIWVAVLVASAVLFQARVPVSLATTQSTSLKVTKKIKKDKIPGRLGLGFGPFYNHYILEKTIKK